MNFLRILRTPPPKLSKHRFYILEKTNGKSKNTHAIAVNLATSLVATPYLLIRNYYHKKVTLISKGAYALHDFLMLYGPED